MKKWRRYVAAICAVLLVLSVGITGAAYAGPQQPEITKCLWAVTNGVKSTSQGETSFVIRSSATVDPSELLTAGDDDYAVDVDIFDLIGTTYAVNFYISFPAEGGFRLRLSEEENKSGFFNPAAYEPIRYTALADGRLSMRSESGSDGTVVYYSTTANGFRLTVGNTARGELFSFTSDDIKLAYRGGEVKKTEIRLPLKADEAIYNGGERFNDVNQRGYEFSLRNVDAAYHGSSGKGNLSSDHTYSYINVPLFHSDAGYSVWYNMAYSGTANVGKTDANVFSTAFDGGKLDFYVFTGTILENIKKYTDITGKSYIPADKWVFGAEFLNRYYPYKSERIPVAQFTAEGGYYYKFLADPSRTFFFYLGGSALAGYESVNRGERRLYDGSTLRHRDRFLYGGAVTLEVDAYLTDRIILSLTGRERILWGTTTGHFHAQFGLGVKFIIH